MQLVKYIALLLITNWALAVIPDYDKELRWKEQVAESLFDGEIVEIAGEKKFIGIFTESANDSNKAVIIIHGRGAHPDWQDVINPLRVALTDNYNTLSIQMPVLANDATFEQYIKLLPISNIRIATSVDYLETEGYIVDLIIAHSLGTTMASHYLANVPHPITKYVAISSNINSVADLAKIDTAVLDLYAKNDLTTVLASTDKLKQAAKNNAKYTQRMIDGDHFFSDNVEDLIDNVYNWIITNSD